MKNWSNELKTLSEIAITQPHAAWILQQVVPSLPYYAKHEQPLSTSGGHHTNCFYSYHNSPNDTDRGVFALPTRLGGLGLGNPEKQCDMQFSTSMLITKKLIESILLQDPEYSSECPNDQITAEALIKKQRQEQATQAAEDIKQHLTPAYHKSP